VHLPLPQLVAYIFGTPSPTSSSLYDSHARSGASDHLNQSSHLVMHAITSCHIEKWKISVHFCGKRFRRLCLRWWTRARAVCDVVMNSLLEFADARAFLRAGKHATNPAEKTIVNASRCLCWFSTLKWSGCVLSSSLMNRCFPCTCPVPLHTDDSVDLRECQSKNGAPGVIALFSSSNLVRDIVQLSFTPLR